MTTPIRHAECGGIAMWYVGDESENRARSKDIIFLDGSRPLPCTVPPKCPVCGIGLMLGGNLKRCFDEDLDPGEAVKAAIKKITT